MLSAASSERVPKGKNIILLSSSKNAIEKNLAFLKFVFHKSLQNLFCII